MTNRVLLVDPDSVLNSKPIQIIHKHPDFAHRKRSDLDPYEFVAASYPIALANKIIPFLDLPPQANPHKRQKSVSPTRRIKRSKLEDVKSKTEIKKTTSPCILPPTKLITLKFPSTTTATSPNKPTLESLPTPHFTPPCQRTLLPLASPGTVNTVYTSRTISPGGTNLSPLKPFPGTWSSPLKDPNANIGTDICKLPIIPTALFTPARPSALTLTLPCPDPTTQTQPPAHRHPLVTFTSTPHPFNLNTPLPTLTLRHNLPTQALRDVFVWARESVQRGHSVNLKGWMIHFRDTARIREIMEVCLVLGLDNMARMAEGLLEELEGGFGRTIK